MKRWTALGALLLALAVGAPASGEAGLKLKLRLEPVTQDGELLRLMRENSRRIQRQRKRLLKKLGKGKTKQPKPGPVKKKGKEEKGGKVLKKAGGPSGPGSETALGTAKKLTRNRLRQELPS